MADYRINERCIIGNPACNNGFGSARMCFIARPADEEFQLEEDIINQLLTERNYETYVALQKIDPGNFAFCTKICSKIIMSHFCIVILNSSSHAMDTRIKIPNPNVYFEYGMMKSFYKHIIPIQRENETLPFNIYPIDTIKYTNSTFKNKIELAIDDMIMRVTTKESPTRPIGAASSILKYFSFKGLRYTNMSDDVSRTVYNLGAPHGFNLFDGKNEIVFFGYFNEEEPREIIARTKFLINNIDIAYSRIYENPDIAMRELARRILKQLRIEVLIPEDADSGIIIAKVEEFKKADWQIPFAVIKSSEIEFFITNEYAKIRL